MAGRVDLIFRLQSGDWFPTHVVGKKDFMKWIILCTQK